MNISSKGNAVSIALAKAETARMLEASYIARRIARNLTDVEQAKRYEAAADANLNIAHKFGAKFFDDEGNFIESPQRQAVNETGVTTRQENPVDSPDGF